MGFKQLSKFFLACSLSLFIAYSPVSQAIVITMDAAGVPFEGQLLNGTSNIGILFFHGRGGNNNGNYVKLVGATMNAQGYTTLSLANPEPLAGTEWVDYLNEETLVDQQLFARLDAALTEMASLGVEHVVLSGISMGSRLMTTAAAAWDLGLFNPTANISLDGLVGVSMYADTGGIAGTTDNPSSLSDFNAYDTHKNLSFINSIPVLDLYGSLDPQAVVGADTRRNAYAGDPSQYVQTQIQCPPNNGQYYAFLGAGVYEPYYGTDGTSVDRCHQLRDGYVRDANGNYSLDFLVRGTIDAPLDSAFIAFMDQYVVPRTEVPEPSSLLLLVMGLPLLLLVRRKKSV